MGKFSGMNAVVTGASYGLGRVIAVEMAKEGANLAIVDFRTADDTIRTIKDLGGIARWFNCDVTSEIDVTNMVNDVSEYFGSQIDILINNAGFNGKGQLIKDMQLSDWDKTIRVNLTGTMLVCRGFIPYMQTQKSGVIVNVSSNVARRGLPYRADYVSSKWAVLGLTQTMALELVKYGIRANAVCPGPISGDRIEQVMAMHAEAEGRTVDEVRRDWANVPMQRFIEAEEVAKVIVFLCSDNSSAMTGQALNVTGGFIMT